MAEEKTTTTKPETEAPTVAVADAPATEAAAEAPKATSKKKKVKRSVPHGQVHILATFNNTIISVTDLKGGVLTYSSAGANGFRGSKKGTAYAAQIAAEKALDMAKQNYGLSKADVYVKGIGMGRDAAVRALSSAGIAMETIYDVTGVPHGGVRPKKARRV